ncbi:hypothetical protein M0R45_004777 [Rubus argutus]|uniref:Uncharacterized protein n=1 Tax=Rubus argutus TaxID=59490 RepID=A0AAW1YKV2_RUBAR
MDKIVVIKFNGALGTGLGFGGPNVSPWKFTSGLHGAQLLGVTDPTTCQLAALVALQSSSVFHRACVCGSSYCICCCYNHTGISTLKWIYQEVRGQLLLRFGGGSVSMDGRVKQIQCSMVVLELENVAYAKIICKQREQKCQ